MMPQNANRSSGRNGSRQPRSNTVSLMIAAGLVVTFLLVFVILLASDTRSPRAGNEADRHAAPHSSEPKPVPQPIDVSRPTRDGSAEFFPGAPTISFDQDGRQIGELPPNRPAR
jgi:hypothetical protein